VLRSAQARAPAPIDVPTLKLLVRNTGTGTEMTLMR
jgi:hypothetical protein